MVSSLGRGIVRGGGGRSPPPGKSSCEVIEVRAPALPAQRRFLGGGFGRGAKPPSESSSGHDAPHGTPPAAGLRARPARRAGRAGRGRGLRRPLARGRALLPRGLCVPDALRAAHARSEE